MTFTNPAPMDIGAHPHIGLQTVTWLLDGELVHYDSLGHESLLQAGGVNVMTSGAGIAHAERTPEHNSGRMNGVQLWVALPEHDRHQAAAFQHVPEAPVLEESGGLVRVFAGAVSGRRSPAAHYSAIVGGDIQVHAQSTLTLPLDRTFEHGVIVLSGDCSFEGQELQARTLYYLGANRFEASVASRAGARLLLVGGPPFPETILMWWNFVARSPREIADARADWEARQRFGDVVGYRGPRLSAPDLARFAAANPVS